jgi:putative FmdB family regulatory protein
VPIYEYRCPHCENRFETMHPVDAETPPCPRCRSRPRRVYSSIGIVFRGSGFHVTDYRRSGDRDTSDAASENKSSQDRERTADKSE